MTKEELKEQLSQYTSIVKERDELRQLMDEAERSLKDPYGIQLTGMPRAVSGGNQQLERNSVRREELLVLYKKKDEQLAEEQIKIEKMIQSLPSRERNVLRLHYIKGKTWEDVCERVVYSLAQIHRIHNLALEILLRKMI